MGKAGGREGGHAGMSERDNAGDDTDLAGERRPRAAAQLSGKAGILPRQDIRNLVNRKFCRRRPISIPASSSRRASTCVSGQGLPRPRQLPARRRHDRRAKARGPQMRRDRSLESRRRPRTRLRLRRRTPRASEAAGEHFGDGEPEELDRAGSTSSRASSPTAATSSTACPAAMTGPLYAEVSPRSFSVKVRRGSRLNQIRFRRWNSQQDYYSSNVRLSDREHSRTCTRRRPSSTAT